VHQKYVPTPFPDPGYFTRRDKLRNDFTKLSPDLANLFERYSTLVKLPVEEPFRLISSTRLSITRRRRLDEHAARAFHCVGHHKDAGFFRLWLRARIAGTSFRPLRRRQDSTSYSRSLAIKILDECRAVMLLNEIDDRLRESLTAVEVGAVFTCAMTRGCSSQALVIDVRLSPWP